LKNAFLQDIYKIEPHEDGFLLSILRSFSNIRALLLKMPARCCSLMLESDIAHLDNSIKYLVNSYLWIEAR